ncbi:hypothetical protein AB0D13_20185 [Streptomyces sp. NPDC048430]|uniref:hypothetical protein n=1 Tax=Streptomyces sp. NPDC048430 TaxID=3155388 RepID=UPI003423B172
MSDQQPIRHPDRAPGAHMAYAPPQAPAVSDTYRRWAGILVRIAAVIAFLMAAAFVASLVLLVRADADTRNAAYGYLAVVLWAGIALAIPVLLAVGIPGVVMRRRVRQQGTWPS